MSSDRTWEKIQQKTFTGWVNSHLRKRNLVITDVTTDLQDGLKLIALLEIISDEEIPKKAVAKNPTMRIQKVQNVGVGLKFISDHHVKLAGIGAEEIVDGNLKMILGMIWTIILRFSIQDISLEDLSAKEGLLLWCQKKTHGYPGVNVKNFHMSFQDGLAFCALIHKHRPDLLDWDSLDKSNKALCLQTAFDVAERSLDIPKLLDPADMLDVAKPDERSVMTYVSLYYHVFASSQKAEVAGRRVAKVLDFAESIDKLKNDYNSRAQQLVDWINNSTNQLNDRSFDNTLEGVLDQLNDFKTFKSSDKPPKFNEKVELEALINALQTKLQLNNRPAFVPPHGLGSGDLNNLWAKLEQAESDRGIALREELRRQKRINDLLRRFLKLAGSLENWSSDRSSNLSNTDYGDSVSATTAKLKNLEAFDGEFEAQNKRTATLHDYERQLAELNYHDIATIHARASGVDGALGNLRNIAENRKVALTEHLRKLEEREKQLLDFAKRALEFRVWLEGADEVLSDPIVCETVEYAKELQANFEQIVAEKSQREGEYNELNELAANLQGQGVPENTYSDVSIATLNSLWNSISGQFDSRRADLEAEVQKQQSLEDLRLAFAQKAKAVHSFAKQTLAQIESLSGDLDSQLEAVQNIQGDVASHQSLFDEAIRANQDLEANKITDNPHTEITVETLKSFWDGLLATLKKKQQVLEKERLSKGQSGLSAEQLAEFRECFFHFDKDEDKLLSRLELGACLKSLGEELTFEAGSKLDTILTSIDGDADGKVTFDEFVGYMERSSTGSDTADSIKQAFRTIAGDKDYVTKNELQSVLPADKVEYILARIKPYPGVDNAYDYNTFTDALYQ